MVEMRLKMQYIPLELVLPGNSFMHCMFHFCPADLCWVFKGIFGVGAASILLASHSKSLHVGKTENPARCVGLVIIDYDEAECDGMGRLTA